jgi:hypothetical protein
MSSVSLPDEVRAACAWVMERARHVHVVESEVEGYAKGLAGDAAGEPVAEEWTNDDPEDAAAFAICMNAINFGSGWWPTIRKRAGLSGYGTIAAGLRERCSASGSWRPEELATIEASEVAEVVGQDPSHPLMADFGAALRDVGEHLLTEFDGRYLGAVEGASTIPDLSACFAAWDAFADVSSYEGREVPFFKRAQLAAADLHRAGVANLPDVKLLTAFADNLVPHVLRADGLLRLDHDLTAAIEAEELLPHGSPPEVELRAAAVHAVELLSAATGGRLSPAEIDSALWNRGAAPRYKSRPRPRSRNTAY